MIKDVIELFKIKLFLENECQIDMNRDKFKCVEISSYSKYTVKTISKSALLSYVLGVSKSHNALFIEGKLIQTGHLTNEQSNDIKSNLEFEGLCFTTDE